MASVVVLLIFLPRSTGAADDIPASNAAERSEAMPVYARQDPGDVLAESALGRRVPTSDAEKAGIEADMQIISRFVPCGLSSGREDSF